MKHMPPSHIIVHNSKYQHQTKDGPCIIHRRRRDWQESRKRHERDHRHRIDYCININGHAPFTQRVRPILDVLASQSFGQQAADRDYVADVRRNG